MSQYLRDLAERKFSKASRLMQKGKQKEALVELQEAEEAAQKAKANDILLRVHGFKGYIMQTLGAYEEALKVYSLTLNAAEDILSKEPNNKQYNSNLQTNLESIFILGNIFHNNGYFLQAKSCFELHLSISQKLLAIDPENVTYLSNVGGALNDLGNLFRDMGRLEETKQKLDKALEIEKKLLTKDPENVIYKSNIGGTLNNFGNLLRNMGRLEEAKQKLDKALEIRIRLLKNNPKNKEYQSDVAMSLNNLGALLYDMGLIEEAKKRFEEALKIYEKLLENNPENVSYQLDVATTLNNLGNLLQNTCVEQAEQMYEKALKNGKEVLKADPENTAYQSIVAMMLNNVGALLKNKGLIEEAKKRFEEALKIYEKLLQADPRNLTYQSDVAMTLNNLGALFKNIGRTEEAKKRYEKALEIYTEPMQYLTISKKLTSIIRLMKLNAEQAETETNDHLKIKYLEEAYKLCKESQVFLCKYELKYEKKLIMEAGLRSYLDHVITNIKGERKAEKRAEGYEKAIKTIEKLNKVGDNEDIKIIASSAICYLEGRKLINEAIGSKKPDLELIKKATDLFKDAKETYKKANICYCIYIGLLKILENIEIFEKENGLKAKEMIDQIIEILPEDIDQNIRISFEEIAKTFGENGIKSRKKHLEEFDEKIRTIESKSLENIFGHVLQKLKEYIEEPFSPNLFYSNWKLRITFDDPEKVKGKLTVKTGNTILFDRALSMDEIKDNEIEIDYLERRYIPSDEGRVTFETINQKQVIRDLGYSETISKNKKARIFLHNCCNDVCAAEDLKVAVVQLKYDVYGEDYAVKILKNEAYKRKVMIILDAVKEKANIVVFPEFSIPFDYLEDIQEYANRTGIIVFAGTHYITEENLEKYEKLFSSDFVEEDLRKNICPIVIPNSRIIHNEKMFGAKEERDLFFHKGMRQGKMNHIFKLRDNLTLGALICFEYLNDELRHRLISVCDVIFVPQTNPGPARFYSTAKNDLNNPPYAGNKTCIMANGIFRIGKMKDGQFVPEKKEILGGSSGVMLTLDKDSSKMQDEGIISYIKDQKEQFILLATINTQFYASRDVQLGQVPIKTALINIFEEQEIYFTKNENIKKENAEEFLTFIRNIKACTDRKELKNLIEENRNLIAKYSPLMHEHTANLTNMDFGEIKEQCQLILIPAN